MSELREHLFVPYSELQKGDELTDAITIAKSYYLKSEVDTAIAEKDAEIRRLRRNLWLMTAEWAEGMGLASCNIASKFMSRENFEVGDDYRNDTIKKYKHRQVVFYKFADYCRAKVEECK